MSGSSMSVQWWRDDDVFDVEIADCGLYRRGNHDEVCVPLIREYAEQRSAGSEPPPVVVSKHDRDGKTFYSVVDGYHRLHEAAERGDRTVRAVTVESALAGLYETVEQLAAHARDAVEIIALART